MSNNGLDIWKLRTQHTARVTLHVNKNNNITYCNVAVLRSTTLGNFDNIKEKSDNMRNEETSRKIEISGRNARQLMSIGVFGLNLLLFQQESHFNNGIANLPRCSICYWKQ